MEKARELAVVRMLVELKKRDYTSFGPIAKVRFRPMCEDLGFEQTTGTVYHRERNEWVDFISLSTSQWGGNGFDINYGINLDKLDRGMPEGLCKKLVRAKGKPMSWNRFTKKDVENSAKEAHLMFLEQAEPFLQSFRSKKDVALAFLQGTSFMLERTLSGSIPRNQFYIDRVCETLNWAGMEETSLQIRNGTYTGIKDNETSIFKKWFSKK